MNERKLLGLIELAKNGATPGEREAARNALRSYVARESAKPQPRLIVTRVEDDEPDDFDDSPVAQPPAPVAIAEPEVTWRRSALQLGVFMTVACIAASEGWSWFWILAVSAICAAGWKPKV
jgi:hypothetical protein